MKIGLGGADLAAKYYNKKKYPSVSCLFTWVFLYQILQSSTLGDGNRRESLKNKNLFFSVAGIKTKSSDFTQTK